MIGAVIADMLSMKKVVKLYLIVSVIYIALGIFNGGGSGMVSFLVFFAVMLVLASFSYNDICHWDKFINVTPVRRIEIVAAKYIFALDRCGSVGADRRDCFICDRGAERQAVGRGHDFHACGQRDRDGLFGHYASHTF